MNDASPFRVPTISPELVESFTGMVFDGQEADFEQMVEQLLAGGASPESLMLELLAPAARLMGEHWCQDSRDFVEVTLGMARLQQLVRQFRLPSTPRVQLRGHALLVPVPGEQHTFGLRVVEEHLLRAGWKVTVHIAAGEADIARLAAEEFYDFVGLSLSSERLLPALRQAARSLRPAARNRNLRIAAGGVLFDGLDLAPGEIGADAIVTDARDAVNQAQEWSSLAGAE
ncbi:MAG: cobalamin B12-binding domain-containing protein [Aestuariivirga sp.]|uniref:cobalamin B12-binding domain-containing protein n=1 Tax=Aestuariivirga sp. TaxID=2650926 RepID=UPI0025C100BF|nr:cobalamin B12-binding domain-containing protein [Aestuariivirga sp.]MCA3559673.1 cobalamin B12-binding domain-containing protein [Aestuariivirga sp.]